MAPTLAPAAGNAEIPSHATHLDPLLDCLFALARGYGIHATRESLTAGIPLRDNRLTPSLFGRSARRVGLASRLLRLPLERVRDNLLPAVLLLDGEEACILRALDGDAGTARVSFPELIESEVTVPLSELTTRYGGLALFVRPRYRFERRAPELSHVRSRHWFWQTLFQGWPLYRDAMAAAFMINIFALTLPLLSMNVYDRVVPNMATETLWVLALGAFLVLVFDFLLRMTRAYLLDLASKRVDISLSALIMERVLGLRMEGRPSSVGAFAANLRAFESIRDFIASASIAALIDLPFLLIFLLVILWVSPWLTLPVLLGSALTLGYAWIVQDKMKDLSDTTLRAAAQRNALLIENLGAIETIKVLGAEGRQQRAWEQSTLYLAQVGARLKMLAASTASVTGFIQQTVYVAMLVLGVYLIIATDVSQGGVIAAVMLSGRCMAPLAQVVGLMTQYHNAKSSLTSLEGLMRLPVEREADAAFFHRTGFSGDIEFKDVSFAYPGNPTPVLEHVSFRIGAGERVAIVGKVGSGKTTLQKMIMGLYRPGSGSIRIDGIDIQQIDPAELRRHIGYVPQDPVLFYGTMRQNIVMRSPHAHDASIAAAAEAAGLSGFINGHPLGFDMIIGERGETLSGGQRQAVTLARALLETPPMLLLDEPTGQMDQSSEAHIRQTLQSLLPGRTVLLVTHNQALLALVDRLIVVDRGRIVADGPKADVMRALQQGTAGRAS